MAVVVNTGVLRSSAKRIVWPATVLLNTTAVSTVTALLNVAPLLCTKVKVLKGCALPMAPTTDTKPLAFSGALHTYFAVSDVAQARLTGLGGRAEWDSVTDHHAIGAPELRFAGEFDRVYSAAPEGCVLHDGAQSLAIGQDMDWTHTVVWNPGAEKCATLADMPTDGWQHMLCVEAAQVYEPIRIEAGDFWQGAQRLQIGRAHV